MSSMNRVLSAVVLMILAALPFAGSVRAKARRTKKLYVVTHVDLTA